MKVFISWSGTLSCQLGSALRDWLPSVLQLVRPYFTPDDVDKGSRWASHIAKELEDSSLGIFCVTADNQNSQWMMFEAGAISKRLAASHVCPLLFGLTASDLKGPLTQFQATPFEHSEMKKLMVTINSLLGDHALGSQVLDNVFEKWWPDLDSRVKGILAEDAISGTPNHRSDRDILSEVLELTRHLTRTAKETSVAIGPIDPKSIRQGVEGLVALHSRINGNPDSSLVEHLKSVCHAFVEAIQPHLALRPLLGSYTKRLTELSFSTDEDIPF